MRLIIATLALATLLDLGGCGGNTPRINWPAVAQCSTQGATGDLLQTVAAILVGESGDTSTSIGERAVTQVAQLAEDRGAMAVECLVDEAVRGFEAQAPSREALMAAPLNRQPLPAQLAAARGRDFLQRVAVARVERSGP